MAPSTVQRRTQQKTTMTTTTKSSSLNKSQQVKPFCKVCYDTGKPELLFSNHFVRETRDPNSRIVCPTLLALECRYCFVRGHTVSKCPKLEKVKAEGECNHSACHAPRKTKPLSRDSDTESNGFSLLYSSDDENDDIETNVTVSTKSTDMFPYLNNSGITVNEVSNKTYAAALMSILSEKQSFSHSGHQRWPPNTTNSKGCFASAPPLVVPGWVLRLETPLGSPPLWTPTPERVWKKPVANGYVGEKQWNVVEDDASCVSSVSTSSSCVGFTSPLVTYKPRSSVDVTDLRSVKSTDDGYQEGQASPKIEVNVDLRKVFKNTHNYSAPGSWADASDSDDE